MFSIVRSSIKMYYHQQQEGYAKSHRKCPKICVYEGSYFSGLSFPKSGHT